MCEELGGELSYYRRLLHGRMDLLAFELRRRHGEETRSLIEALPDILADPDAGPPLEGTLPQKPLPIEAPDLPATGRRSIDRVLSDDFLAHLPSLDDTELAEIQSDLTTAEREVSKQRNSVYDACEQVQEELTRRYREGLATVDELLQR